MKSLFYKVAHFIYRATPWQPLRKLYFDIYARLVRQKQVAASVDGIRLHLDLGEVIDLSLYLGQYEADVRRGIQYATAPGMTVLDIGANIGAHAFVFAKLVGPAGRVIAFEPTAYAFEKLRRNAALNPDLTVELVHVALSDVSAAAQDINFRSSWRTDGGRKDGASVVDFVPLDRWCDEHGIDRVDLIKIDVDGNEFPIISGGRKTIERFRPTMLMEVVGPHFDDDQRNPFAILASLGYRFWHLKEWREITIEEMRQRLPRNDVELTISMNVLAAQRLPAEAPKGEDTR